MNQPLKRGGPASFGTVNSGDTTQAVICDVTGSSRIATTELTRFPGPGQFSPGA